jgi:hypothetical protein
MRTSNKLLLSLLVAIVVALTVFVALLRIL